MLTTDKNHPDLGRGTDVGQVPQNKAYLVLSDEELAKGFVRPLRKSYIHTGKYIGLGKIVNLSVKEIEDFKEYGYVAFLEYDKDKLTSSAIGHYLTKEALDNYENGFIKGCGGLTVMADKIAETYARDPKFYGSTYCMGCQRHIDVREFTWAGTDELVGS